MNDAEKCFNCKHLKFREGYSYPYRCERHKEYTCKDSEIRNHFQIPCKFYKQKERENNV